MALGVAAAYLNTQVALRRFTDAWARWGDSAADKAEAVLHVLRAPTTPEDIYAAMGSGSATSRAVREALYADHRFIRASRQTWGLRAWGTGEYVGIFDEIAARIDAAPGGNMNVDILVHELLSRFPDIAES